MIVAIPSGRGIRSGHGKRDDKTVVPDGRNPLWSGHSFRQEDAALSVRVPVSQSPLVGAFVPAQTASEMVIRTLFVAIPSGRGIRSGKVDIMKTGLQEKVAIPSGRGIRSGSGWERH